MNSELLSCFKDLEIKTSIESKGAEYKQVVLYGFGDYFLNNFDFNNNNNNNDFQIMYYFNKLYVAITRAKTEIVIIDSSKSKEDFWEKLICNAEITNQNAWGKLKEIQSKVIVYDTHSINNILYSTKEDALENAKEDERLGVFYQNPSRLKVAASQFLRLSKEDEANKCLGLAYEINHDYKNAADYFRKANMLELASKSLFKGLYLNELETIGKNLQSPEHELRMIISRFMSNEFITINDIERLLVNKELLVEILKNLPWYDDLLRIINLYLIENKNIDFIENLIKVVLAFIKSSDTELYNTIAELKYNFRMYKEAIEIWESIDYYTSEKYFIAKYKYYDERNDYENKVIYLHEQIQFKEDKKDKQSLYKEIIHINDKYVSEKIDDYSNEYFLIILKSLILLNEFDRVSIFIKEVEERVYPSEFEECIKNIIINEKISNNLFNYLILEWAKFIVSSEEFDNNYLNEINSIYKNKSEQLNIIYKPFEFNEIKRIIENTEDYEFNPNGHITHIIINNFRQFENLTIENIGQFNLIVGDNNVGKTSLLEALLFVNDPEVYYTNLAFAYIARNNSNLIRNNDSNIEHYDIPIEFINDFFRFNDTKNGINFILFENRQQWKFSFQTPSKEDIIRDFDIKTGINEKEFISMNIDKNCISVHELSTIIKKIDPYDIIKMQLIPFGKGFDKTLARSYFKNIDNDRSKRTTLLEAMKVFIPNIDRITADTSSGIINIEETNKNDAYPIHQYGEGANKLFRILVQLSLLKDKKLLIDEIDAGIHFSHFKRFWEIIIKVAKENNVQLFVTTHNIECIEYFKDIVEYNEEYQSLSKVITLRKLPQKDEIKAYTYNFNEFDHQIDNDFEIRGGEL